MSSKGLELPKIEFDLDSQSKVESIEVDVESLALAIRFDKQLSISPQLLAGTVIRFASIDYVDRHSGEQLIGVTYQSDTGPVIEIDPDKHRRFGSNEETPNATLIHEIYHLNQLQSKRGFAEKLGSIGCSLFKPSSLVDERNQTNLKKDQRLEREALQFERSRSEDVVWRSLVAVRYGKAS